MSNSNTNLTPSLSSSSEKADLLESCQTIHQQSLHNTHLENHLHRDKFMDEILQDSFGLGVLEPLLTDPTVSDILINGPKLVLVERDGCIQKAPIVFEDNHQLIQIVQRILGLVGCRLDETSPSVDVRLPDGSRINAVIPPLAIDGALVSIRKFSDNPFTLDDLVGKEAMLQEMAVFLEAAVQARMNLIVAGGTGAGKTTLLNALSACIPHHERIVTIEDVAELHLQQPYVARLETTSSFGESSTDSAARDLVRNALRMRPDRIVVGQCRGVEALDLLQAMNTGHEGSMTTIHANDLRDALSRLEVMIGIAGVNMPIWVIRRQISSSVRILVQVNRLRGGARRITSISELTDLEGEMICTHDLFGFERTSIDSEGHARGYFYASEVRPKCMKEFEEAGIDLDPAIFSGQRYEV